MQLHTSRMKLQQIQLLSSKTKLSLPPVYSDFPVVFGFEIVHDLFHHHPSHFIFDHYYIAMLIDLCDWYLATRPTQQILCYSTYAIYAMLLGLRNWYYVTRPTQQILCYSTYATDTITRSTQMMPTSYKIATQLANKFLAFYNSKIYLSVHKCPQLGPELFKSSPQFHYYFFEIF